jgi:hypothetical protein
MPGRKVENWSPPELISIEREGVRHEGRFQTNRTMIRVSYGSGTKTTQLGGLARSPASLARLILSEIVRETPTDA